MKKVEKYITAIAVDDEPRALEIIGIHAGKIPTLDLVKTFRDPIDAIQWLSENRVDLLFLDINMPELSGLKFRQLIGDQTMIIFTTAYSEYAVESYEQNAIDYLVKPIRFERFLQAIQKIQNQVQTREQSQSELPVNPFNRSSIFVKSGTKSYRLYLDEILYLQKDGNYVVFFTKDKKVLSRLNMSQIKDILPQNTFIRIHKSFVVNINQIEILETHQVTINGQSIPIAKNYREALLNLMGS